LVISELGVVEDSRIPKEELLARSGQLKRICTYFMKDYDWSSVREYHGAFLSIVEKSGQWQVDTNELASQFLSRSDNSGNAAPQAGGNQYQGGDERPTEN